MLVINKRTNYVKPTHNPLPANHPFRNMREGHKALFSNNSAQTVTELPSIIIIQHLFEFQDIRASKSAVSKLSKAKQKYTEQNSFTTVFDQFITNVLICAHQSIFIVIPISLSSLGRTLSTWYFFASCTQFNLIPARLSPFLIAFSIATSKE